MKRSPYALLRAGLAAVLLLSPIAISAGDFAEPGTDFAARVLASHNVERGRLGMRPLHWSAQLSQDAQQWADSLARRGAFEHAQGRDDTGENLWMGAANWFSPEQMVGEFLSERAAFRPGRFPNVSNTGNWSDVGHYTQVIWPETQAVGCAIARGGRQEVLVCRYWPAGNVDGERIG
jgi:uncharacterized protein YkwD